MTNNTQKGIFVFEITAPDISRVANLIKDVGNSRTTQP